MTYLGQGMPLQFGRHRLRIGFGRRRGARYDFLPLQRPDTDAPPGEQPPPAETQAIAPAGDPPPTADPPQELDMQYLDAGAATGTITTAAGTASIPGGPVGEPWWRKLWPWGNDDEAQKKGKMVALVGGGIVLWMLFGRRLMR